MSLLEQQNLLAKMFVDKDLRESFWREPNEVGEEFNLTSEEISQLQQIVENDLNYFAESLFHKRLHEVEKLLPLTKKVLEKDFKDLFREFSNQFQPVSIKKHLEDAIEFCRYLQSNEFENLYAKDVAKFEQTKHEFFSLEKSFSFCFLRRDIFSNKKRPILAIWYRSGNQAHHLIL